MPPSSIKGALFEALREAGPDGLDMAEMVTAVQVCPTKPYTLAMTYACS